MRLIRNNLVVVVKFANSDVTIGPDEDYTEGDLQFINEVKGGNGARFIPSVQKGFADCLSNGVLGGFPMTNLKVTLTDGSFHPVDSDQLSFRISCTKLSNCFARRQVQF